MAAEDIKGKKRKGAADAAPKPKKQKKSDDIAGPKKPSVKETNGTAKPSDGAPKAKVPRKRAEEKMDVDAPASNMAAKEKNIKKKGKVVVEVHVEAQGTTEKPKKTTKKKSAGDSAPAPEIVAEAPKEQVKKSRKVKGKETDVTNDDTAVIAESKKSKKSKKAAKEQKAPKEPSPEVAIGGDDEQDAEEDSENDQTAALLAGFESEGDESDQEKEEGFTEDQLSDNVPKGLMKKLKKVSNNREEPGVIFVGRIPHGFYEPQMKAYFSQFGKVTRIRVSRNKKTGASKHYAFVEFASAEVAEIVAKTMDKYLMFGHILQCRVIPPEQVHPNLFVGANTRFKRVPRNKMAGLEMARGAERSVWEKRVENEKKRRESKSKDLKEKLGYEYSAPTLKGVEDVPKKAATLEDAGAQPQIEAPVVEVTAVAYVTESSPGQLTVTETVTTKKPMKASKSKVDPDADRIDVAEKPEAVTEKAPKKGKKSKATVVDESVAGAEAVEDIKPKKTKKAAEKVVVEDAEKPKKRKDVPSADLGVAKAKKTKKTKA